MGKTTVALGLLAILKDAGFPVRGFTTRELREGPKRVGFVLETTEGRSGVLAHVRFPGPVRVGPYGVNISGFEAAVLPLLAARVPGELILIDEIGRMELASAAFRDLVWEVLQGEGPVVATVHVHSHPLTDALKTLPGVEVIRVTEANRSQLPQLLAARLLSVGRLR